MDHSIVNVQELWDGLGVMEPIATANWTLEKFLATDLETCILSGNRACNPQEGDIVDYQLVPVGQAKQQQLH